METGVLQRDSRVWLHPKRRLACPLGRLPMKPNGARRRRGIDVPRRGTLLRSGQHNNCAKRHSVSSTEAKSRYLCLTRMRVNAQEEKRKHGITCNTSSPLEKGRAEGAGWMCLEEAPPSTQRPVCQLCKALLHIVNGSEAVGSLPHSYASKCAGRETKARYYMRYE